MLPSPTVFWGCTEDLDVDAAERGLTPVERARAQRFRDEPSRRRFVLGARLLRESVAAGVGTQVDEVEVSRRCPDCAREHGQPRVRAARPDDAALAARLADLSVSVSHSDVWVVVAICEGSLVGVDIEARAGDAVAAVDRELVLHPGERVGSGEDLLRTWVRKEALLKATGDGLRLPPAGIELAPLDSGPRLVAWVERPELVPRTAITDLVAPDGVVGALAVVGPAPPARRSPRPARPGRAPQDGRRS